MMSILGAMFGELLCLYLIAFRWNAIVAKYGRFDLIFWTSYVVIACSLLGWLVGIVAGLAIWGVRYALWAISSGTSN
jgi:hypothetical protein